MKLLRFISLNSVVFLIAFAGNAQVSRAYMLDEADTYFKAGRYYDAFFRYRECAKLPEFEATNQITQQVKNSSHALYLTQKFKDYFALKKLQPAKDNLVELISLNANDPNRGQLAHITLAQGAELQRSAWRQQTPAATADMLKRAIALYFQAAKEGLMEESISAIKQCEASIKETKVPIDESVVSQPTTPPNVVVSPTAPVVASPRKTKPEVIIIPAPKQN